MRFEAIAYDRAVWEDVPVNECWDVEQTLCLTGCAVWHADTRKLVPVYASDVTIVAPWRTPELTDADGVPYNPYVDTLIRVTAATPELWKLDNILEELDSTLAVNVKNARVTLFAKGLESNSGAIEEFIRSVNKRTPIPILKASSDMDVADIVRVGDGSTHADELQRAYATAAAHFCQLCGVHYNDTEKAERLVVDEVEGAFDAVEIVKQNEITQRLKLAELTGWKLAKLYGKDPNKAEEETVQDAEQITIEEGVSEDNAESETDLR